MNRQQLLDKIQSERQLWDSLRSRINQTRMSERGIIGNWSVKDTIAHITWYDYEMVNLLKKKALIDSNLWNLSTDERNIIIFEKNHTSILQDVIVEANSVFQELILEVQALSQEDLKDPKLFQNMPETWIPWKVIASNTYEHYDHHRQKLHARINKHAFE